MNRHRNDWRPAAGMAALEARGRLLSRIRTFFARRGVLEVETPVLSAAGNSDPGMRQWRTDETRAWLRTSPEYAMKRLLAAGCGDIYELGRVFREGESGRYHNREFTLLEWYRLGWSYQELMDEAQDLLRFCWPGQSLPRQDFSYRQLFQEFAGLDPVLATDEDLRQRLVDAGVTLDDAEPRECLDLLLSEVIQPALPPGMMTFVRDFPPDQAALARIRSEDPPVAERFELFLGPLELANGYQELTDGIEQRQRFERENADREDRGTAPVPLDERLLAALEAGLPDCAGVALGVDRLLMAMLGLEDLHRALAFPAERA